MAYSNANLKVNVDNIPGALKKYNQWIGWLFEKNDQGQKTKVPKHIVKGYNASIKKPQDWVAFETCLKYIKNFAGIGFVTSKNDPFVIWDLDACRNIDTGVINEQAIKIIDKLNSYTEISPSGKGIRIIVKGTIGVFGRRNRTAKIEAYDSCQYLTITGHHLRGTPKTIKKRNKIGFKLHKEVFSKQVRNICKNKKNEAHLLHKDMEVPILFSSES